MMLRIHEVSDRLALLLTGSLTSIGSLVTVLVVLIVFGVALWLIETYVPMAPPIKVIIRVVVILVLAIWLLRYFGVLGM